MSGAPEIPVFSEIVAAVLLVLGAVVTLIGSAGLLKLGTFYERVHAPTLGTTLGATCVALASIVHFSALEGRLAVHGLLIVAFITVTTPISLIILVRAAVLRTRAAQPEPRATRTDPSP
jgi:multicomponent K+:H+ antiporter subunit G